MFSLAECVSWLAVTATLSLAIIILNLITIIVFMKNRNLRKRSTYLMLNLAVIDMLAGVIAMESFAALVGVYSCNLWKDGLPDKLHVYFGILEVLFPVASVTNITAISLERLHATFWPLRHRVMQKWIYRLIVASTWATAGLVSIAIVVLQQSEELNHFFYLWNSFYLVCLLIISVSYVSIVIKVRGGAQLQHHGAASRERKLTMTLFIVTFVSILMWLPFVMSSFLFFATNIFSSLSSSAIIRLSIALSVLYYVNSLVNPILYSARMPDFRRALVSVFCKRPRQLNQARVIPLREM